MELVRSRRRDEQFPGLGLESSESCPALPLDRRCTLEVERDDVERGGVVEEVFQSPFRDHAVDVLPAQGPGSRPRRTSRCATVVRGSHPWTDAFRSPTTWARLLVEGWVDAFGLRVSPLVQDVISLIVGPRHRVFALPQLQAAQALAVQHGVASVGLRLLSCGREGLFTGTEGGGHDEFFSKGFSIILCLSAFRVQFILRIFSFGSKE